MATLFQLLGPTEFAARVFSACCYVSLVVVVAVFTRAWFNEWIALLSAFFLASDRSLVFTHCARSGDLEAALMLCLTLAVFSAWNLAQRRRSWWGGPALATALLVKSVAALQVLPVIAVWLVALKAWRALWRYAALVILATLPFATWLALREARQPGFAAQMVGLDLVARWQTSVDSDRASIYSYLVSFGSSAAPVFWAVVLVALALRGKLRTQAQLKDPSRHKPLLLLLLLWWLLPLLMFTFARTHRDWYIYPSYVPAYILAAWFLTAGIRQLRHRGRHRLATFAAALALAGLGAPSFWKAVHSSRSDRERVLELEQLISHLRQARSTSRVVAFRPDPRVRFYLARAEVPYEYIFDHRRLKTALPTGGSAALILCNVYHRDLAESTLARGPLPEVCSLPRIGIVLLQPRAPGEYAPPASPTD
jgi:4-amino-4-deoxy-L-arabinose transferase-like glycosyltransferase